MSDSIVKQNLAYAYQIMSHLKLDDHTYTHLSARSTEKKAYFIYPFGLRFEEVNPDMLMKISLDGHVMEGQEYQYNKTGYTIHGAIYNSRPDIEALFHVHTPAIVAVSVCTQGLLPLSQWALHFYKRISYHSYDSLEIEASQGKTLQQNLGPDNFVMIMRNHGAMVGGRSLQEAMFYTYHLHQACLAQCLTLSMQQKIVLPSEEVCQRAVQDLISFEKDLGQRDWQAWIRLIDRINPKIIGHDK